MDLLKDAAKNLNLYEVKAYVRKAQNVAMNLSDMEAKVREATNNEPWSASSTMMSQIAAGTYNYREREEILSFIFRRFTEKAANEWRQIYKSLQLLEYLIKNGSERIIDDVRANMSLLQMLRSFHYIDSKGRDQGINVRNRAKSLISLLNDDNLIRTERKKARGNAHKFTGIASSSYGGALSVDPNSHFDDDYSGRVFGDGGVFGARYGDSAAELENQNGSNGDNFEEYEVETTKHSSKATTGSSSVNVERSKSSSEQVSNDKNVDLISDLISNDNSNGQNKISEVIGDDDDFDDFQAAPSTAPKANTPNFSNNLASLYQIQPQLHQQNPAFNSSVPSSNLFNTATVNVSSNNGANYRVNPASYNTSVTSNKQPQGKSGDQFSSLFSSAKTMSHKDSHVSTKTQTNQSKSVPNDDLFGDFSANAPTNQNSNQNKDQNSGKNDEFDLLSF